MRATSQQIAEEYRRQIENGELAPGDRVPSTRAITRHYRVAMATATRALALLQADGLVRAVPGVGTVVRPPSHPQPRRRTVGRSSPLSSTPAPEATAPLDPAAVVASAVELADAEGLEAVSMRRIAADLGVAPMSLYRHVRDKDDLIVQMMDQAIDGSPAVSAEPRAGWRQQVEAAAETLWQTFRAHPWLAEALSLTRPQPLRAGLAYSDRVLAAVGELTDDPAEAFGMHLLILTWVRGVAINLEPERRAESETGLSAGEWTDLHEDDLARVLARDRLPHLSATLTALQRDGFDLDLDAQFRAGLGLLLDGLARRRS